MKHCPICDRTSDRFAFFGEICEVCAGKKLAEKLPNEVRVPLCRDCGRIRVAGVFVEPGEASMQRLLSGSMRRYRVKLLDADREATRVSVTEEGTGLAIEHEVKLLFERTLCDDDSRKRAGYYEAVVQFRGDGSKVERAAAALQRYVERNGGFVTKTEQKQHGVDVYVSYKRIVRAFLEARHIKSESSFKLQGEKGGRRLYRNTYFVTLGYTPRHPGAQGPEPS